MNSHEDDFPTRRDDDVRPRGYAEIDPKEADAIAKQVNYDLENNNHPEKHFQDVLDELHSSQGNARHEAAEKRDREARQMRQICTDLKREATMQLLSQKLRVESVSEGPHGFEAIIKDGEGRRYDATITFTEAARVDLALDAHAVFSQMVSVLCERALEARARYYRRACLVLA